LVIISIRTVVLIFYSSCKTGASSAQHVVHFSLGRVRGSHKTKKY